MAIALKIKIVTNGQKINAIRAWRTIMQDCPAQYGITEAKAFVENNDGKVIDVLMTEVQFARFVVASYGECNGESRGAGYAYDACLPRFIFMEPKMAESIPYDFTK